ncbi:receptor-transporting protein 5 [Pipistrellus kuhlii]|uniref:3CxxC-type domain-containing protein n=1 Tax=Pipistrellus kuhlii TaxID=59472 RepID=A0A7J7XW37_PIPKU|nr:receptor-transporting protein 5 [Pipistrellus kuhlii]KAF6353907.1 hypothetical protein mPipKuh1_015272 [Pipistrellus kuhlii]
MDGMDVWVSTLAQLMAKRKPEDTWELVLEENLASGQLDSGSHEYRLRGLSRLQCSRCQWGWSSAHVHILFHVRWDKDRRLGLVKMRIWAQACQLCPPDARGACQVSLLNVRLFLNKLVLFVLQQCYQESISSDQCPEVCFGDHCEACDLGVCFFQKPPDPAWEPATRSPSAVQAMPALGGAVASRAWDFIPPSAPEPLSESSGFFSEDADIVTVPFTLVGAGKDQGTAGPGEGPPGEAGPQGLMIIGGGGPADQPASLGAVPTSVSILVNIKTPILHGKGHLLKNIKSFQVKGFIFKGFGSRLGQAPGPDADPSSDGAPAGDATLPVPYVLGLTEKGEGSITFPLSLANVTRGPSPLLDLHSSLTFPFVVSDQSQGGAERGSDPALSPASSGSRGSLIIPSSVFSTMQLGGPPGSGCRRSRHCDRHRRRRARRPRSQPRPEEDFLEVEDNWCWQGLDPYEDVWVWMCMIFFVLWTLYLCSS